MDESSAKLGGSHGQDTGDLSRRELTGIRLKAKTIVWFLKGLIKEGNSLRKSTIFFAIRNKLKEKENAKMVENIKEMLSGKKTYLVALSGIIGAILAFSNGQIDATKAIELIIEAILACTVRAGITKSGS